MTYRSFFFSFFWGGGFRKRAFLDFGKGSGGSMEFFMGFRALCVGICGFRALELTSFGLRVLGCSDFGEGLRSSGLELKA